MFVYMHLMCLPVLILFYLSLSLSLPHSSEIPSLQTDEELVSEDEEETLVEDMDTQSETTQIQTSSKIMWPVIFYCLL